MAKGKKKRRSAAFAMDQDGSGKQTAPPEGWTAESIADGESMDVADTGSQAAAADLATPRRIPGKRGQKSRAQKQRRAARMEKGLAHASRVEGKALKLSGSKAKRTSSKSLWVTQKGHK
ncbi:hypothetical protein ACKKBF_B09440 [Auxenochlorella protothecoides x Auxenochlorella symbiontica]